MNKAYYPVLYAMLEENHWNFSIKRAQLAANVTAPTFGPANAFPLPADFVDLVPNDTDVYGSGPRLDWQIEGGQILSNDGGPLNVRYVSSNVTEGQFDPLFAEAFSCALAMNCCEELTQSTGKIQVASMAHDMAINKAKQRNAFQKRPQYQPTSSWLSSRY